MILCILMFLNMNFKVQKLQQPLVKILRNLEDFAKIRLNHEEKSGSEMTNLYIYLVSKEIYNNIFYGDKSLPFPENLIFSNGSSFESKS